MRKFLGNTSAGGAVRISIIVLAWLFLTTGARADTVYTHAGNDFSFVTNPGPHTTMDEETGTFVLSLPLPAFLPDRNDESALLVPWRLADEINMFSGSGRTLTEFKFATGPWREDARLVGRNNYLHGAYRNRFRRRLQFGGDVGDDDEGEGSDLDSPGVGDSPRVGSLATTVPEPGTLGMVFAGLLGLGLLVGVQGYRRSLWSTSAGGAVRISIIFVAWLFLTTGARADTIYTYTGNDLLSVSNPPGPYTPMDKITGTFVLSSPLPANLPEFTDESALLVSWRLSDGVNTFTGTGPTLSTFGFATGPGGEIQLWCVDETTSDARISTESEFKFSGDYAFADDGEFGASNLDSAGVFSSGTTVPEPGILSMMFAGLLALGLLVGVKRYRGNRLATAA